MEFVNGWVVFYLHPTRNFFILRLFYKTIIQKQWHAGLGISFPPHCNFYRVNLNSSFIVFLKLFKFSLE
jgi:hypothetical protein